MYKDDSKRHNLIEQYITEFENQKLEFSELVSGLYSLIEGLESTEKDWIVSFRTEWLTLEEVYAVALDRGETILDENSENLVYEAIENMKTLLKEVK